MSIIIRRFITEENGEVLIFKQPSPNSKIEVFNADKSWHPCTGTYELRTAHLCSADVLAMSGRLQLQISMRRRRCCGDESNIASRKVLSYELLSLSGDPEASWLVIGTNLDRSVYCQVFGRDEVGRLWRHTRSGVGYFRHLRFGYDGYRSVVLAGTTEGGLLDDLLNYATGERLQPGQVLEVNTSWATREDCR